MKNYADYSFWLEECGDLTPRKSLEGHDDCDVAVIGAGFTGLWTAYYLLRQQPGRTVTVLESEVAGFGASGRNGGWCNATMAGLGPAEMARRWGPPSARQAMLALRATLDEVAQVVHREGLHVDLRRGGVLRVAVGRHELPAIDHKYQTLASLDLLDGHRRLNKRETLDRIALRGAEGSLHDPFVQWVQPAKLARQLAEAVERLGGRIYEQSRVRDWSSGPPYLVRTDAGQMKAGALIVATDAYTTQFRSFGRRLLPLYSLIVLTEPLTPQQWDVVGWREPFTLSSERLAVDYLAKTPDGRIMFGGRGAPYHFGSRISDLFDRHEQTHAMLRDAFYSWFPQLRSVRFTHAWGGPLGVPRDWQPNVYFDPRRRFGGAMGYSGQGVAMSNLAGRVLADLAEGRESSLTSLPFVGHMSRNWEPEPLRWLGARYVQRAIFRLDARGARTEKAPTGLSLAERLSRH